MANKLINCKTCGAEMAANAKSCPQCGAKNKKPIFKKWWFWVLIVIIIGIIIGSSSGSDDKPSSSSKGNEVKQEEPINYTHHNVTELFDALKDNALKASESYKGEYVELEGYLGTIDSDGKYIGITADPEDWDYMFEDVQCFIKSDEQLEQIKEMSKEAPIVVRGKITDVGEILGYTLNIDSID